MNISRIACFLLLAMLTGCYPNVLKSSYKDLGTFDTKIGAQNQAIAFILNNYDSLPQDEYYKVLYSYRDARPDDFNRNSLWYQKGSTELALEADINSGMACSWKEVSKTVLEQAAKSSNGLVKIDSLSKPNQAISQCL